MLLFVSMNMRPNTDRNEGERVNSVRNERRGRVENERERERENE